MRIFTQIIFLLAVLLAGASDADAQRSAQGRRGGNVGLLRQLDLSPDQIKQIREINREIAPRRIEARQRLQAANRVLDASIYSDALDEAQVAVNLKNFQNAQAALSAINFETELNIRKILTPVQLARFREMRQQFNERRQGGQRVRGARRSNSVQPRQPATRPQP